MGHLVLNEDGTTHTIYIQGDGGIIANKDSSSLFKDFSKLEVLEGLKYLDTSNVTNMNSMFYRMGTKSLSVDISHFNTSKVTNMYMLFLYSGVSEIYIKGIDTSHVTDMGYMFSNCLNLKEIDLSGLNGDCVKSMLYMFSNNGGLQKIDLTDFTTRDLENCYGVFWYCYNLTELNLNGFNTSNVTNMALMFLNCANLKELNVSHFDTSKVTTMGQMFNSCGSLTSLDLSNFDTSKVKDMSNMFSACYNLTSLDLSNFDTSNVTNMQSFFAGCISLKKLDLSNFNTSNVTNMQSLFGNCNNLTNLDISHFDTSNVTNMQSMFLGCSSLTSLDVSNFDTSNVKTMQSMFLGCSSLTSLDVSNFDTSNVKTMQSMFSNCSSLTGLNLSNFNTSNVTDMQSLFLNCKNLTKLELSSFNTSNVKTMRDMFGQCLKLQTLDVSNFNTSKVTTMWHMFYMCNLLTSLNLNSFDMSNVMDTNSMFYGCHNLSTTINILNLDTGDYSKMFEESANLNNAQIVVNYIDETSDLVDLMIETKSNDSDVIKGNRLSINSITIETENINSDYLNSYSGMKVTLKETTNNYQIQSFKMNGTLVEGNSFIMPDSDVVITEVKLYEHNIVIESTNISSNLLKTIPGTTITLTETTNNYQIKSFKMNGTLVEGNSFVMPDSDVVITDVQLIYNITVKTANITSSLSKATSGTTITLTETTNNYPIYSFKLNGVLVEGNSFIMPNSDAIITEVKLYERNIAIETINISSNLLKAVPGTTITLTETTNNYQIKSFKMNGTLVKGNSFIMPNSDVVITDVQLAYSITVKTTNITSSLSKATSGTMITLTETTNNYPIYSFKLNGTLVEGNSFVMPDSNVVITDVQLIYNITVETTNITSSLSKATSGTTITLTETTNNYQIHSFKLNGVLVEENSFVMPSSDAVITEVRYEVIIESEHNPYPGSLDNKVYGEHTFDGATSLTVTLEYQTQSTLFDYIYLYDSTNKQYGKYGGTTRKTETITIPGNYIKITLKTNMTLNNYYGFKANIIPNYN